MIIFTATHKVTERVFVGNARDDLSLYWEELISYAESHTPGVFFELLKDGGSTAFDLDEFGYAENPSEARELIQEAREELDAALIKIPKNTTRKVATSSSVAAAEVKALLQGLNESEPTSPWEEDLSWSEGEAVGTGKSKTSDVSRASLNSTPSAKSDGGHQASLQVNNSGGIAQAKAVPTRASSSQTRTQKPSLSGAKGSETSPSISTGKTTSSKKEKRIKEAIEEERETRFEARRRKEREEYDSMRDLCLRIESQRLSNKQNIKRAKELAAKRKARSEKADGSSSTTSKVSAPKATTQSRAGKNKSTKDSVHEPEVNTSTLDARPQDLSPSLVLSVDPKQAAAQRQREDIKHLLALIAVKRAELSRAKDIKVKQTLPFVSSAEAVGTKEASCKKAKSDEIGSGEIGSGEIGGNETGSNSAPVSQINVPSQSMVAKALNPRVNRAKTPDATNRRTSDNGQVPHQGVSQPDDTSSRKLEFNSGVESLAAHSDPSVCQNVADCSEKPVSDRRLLNESAAVSPERPKVLNLKPSTNGSLSTETKSVKVVTKRRFGEKSGLSADAADGKGFASRSSARTGRLSLKRR